MTTTRVAGPDRPHDPDRPARPGGAGSLTPALDIRLRFDSALPMVRLVGELDLASAHLVADAVDAVRSAADLAEQVLVDLGGVTFCDLAGLRSLEACALGLEREGRRLVLCRPPSPVKRLIAISGVCSALERR